MHGEGRKLDERANGARTLLRSTLSDISNNAGSVKSFFIFFLHTSPFTPGSGLVRFLFPSASTTTARS